MPRPLWTADFVSGDPNIDDEHLGLVNTLHEILTRIEAGQPLDTLVPAADALLVSCRNHFANEEQLLHRIDYPEVAQHVQSHQALLSRISGIRNEFLSGTKESMEKKSMERLATRLHDLVVLHLLREDKKYFPYLLLVSMVGGEESRSSKEEMALCDECRALITAPSIVDPHPMLASYGEKAIFTDHSGEYFRCDICGTKLHRHELTPLGEVTWRVVK